MANESSLALRVVVNANDADRTLQAITASINQMGVQAKLSMSQIGGASKQAGAEVISLGDRMKRFAREQRQEARGAGFFVQEISQIVPVSGSAKVALEGLGQALIGGLGIGTAIGLVSTAIRLMTDAWREEEQAAQRATDARAKYVSGLDQEVEASRKRARGGGAGSDALERSQLVQMRIADLRKSLAEVTASVNAEKALPASLSNDVLIAQGEKDIVRLKTEIAQLQGDLEKLKTLIRNDLIAAAEGAAKPKGTPTLDLVSSERNAAGPMDQRVTVNPILQLDDSYRKAAEGATQFRQEVEALNDATAQNRFEANEAAASAANWGNAVGSALGAVATGQATVGQALAQVGQMVIQSVVQSAIASITADAARAGAGAAASQAGIPVVGPVLAISAMGAMMTAVMGLLGKVSARAMGGPVGAGMPYLVGERGPELMIPGSSGRIVPNHALGGGAPLVGAIYALDGRSVERVLTANDGEVARAERKRRRRRRT